MWHFLKYEGLSWLPTEPWAVPWGADILLVDWQPGEEVAEISWAQRATLMAMVTRFLRTGEGRYAEAARAMVDGLLRIAVRSADGLCFPEGYYHADGWRYWKPGLSFGLEDYNAVVAGPLLRFFEITCYRPAYALAEGLLSFALKHSRIYGPDGRFLLGRAGTPETAHFHTRTSFALGALKLGLIAERPELIAWAQRVYEQGKTWGTEFGWFPEHLPNRHAETCCTADMIKLALLLGRHVNSAYYADAERYGRNHLFESQYLSLQRLEEGVARLPAEEGRPGRDFPYSSFERVAERQVGAFASRPTLTDAIVPEASAFMQCCNAAGTRALYDLWHCAVEERAGQGGEPARLAVHLRFSVETPALRVVSHEPAEGRLDVTARRACRFSVRLPEGERQALLARAGEVVRPLEARGGYVELDLGAGETARLHYPLRERSAFYEVGYGEHTGQCQGFWRGETLMRVEPPGQHLPLYGRSPDLPPVEPSPSAATPIEAM